MEIKIRKDEPLKQLNRVAHSNPIDIEFQDLSYTVKDYYGETGRRQLLKSINGKFRSGELTAILGPSGAGKSTLLNILAGYVTMDVKGSIHINDHPRDMKKFKKLSAYIMQEDIIQPRLTVKEAMMFAAKLKLSSDIGHLEKEAAVLEVINLLGLEKCYEIRTEDLSGGERKRVAVALELVNNPPVIFLDEPTTGLDNVAIKRCMELLHKITELGRTVICTIHQPPSSLFKNFDQVYVIAQGYCCYNGSPSNLVPFLVDANVACPTTYTPADYIIELVHCTPDIITLLTQNIKNGKSNLINNQKPSCSFEEEIAKVNNFPVHCSLSLWSQIVILMTRTYLQMRRNYSMIILHIGHHIFSGLLIGTSFYNMGNDASQPLSIFKLLVVTQFFFLYTYVMSTVIRFPLERELMQREFFNSWYDLKAYFLTITLSTLPLLLILGVIFVTIIYTIADLPMEWWRFLWFCILLLIVGITAEGIGYCIGSFCNSTVGCLLGALVIVPTLMIALYGMGYRDTIEPMMKVIMGFSYFRYSNVAANQLMFRHRKPLLCNEIYCHYKNTENILRDMGMQHDDIVFQFSMLLFFLVLFRVAAYLLLKFRLTSEMFRKIENYIGKIFKLKT